MNAQPLTFTAMRNQIKEASATPSQPPQLSAIKIGQSTTPLIFVAEELTPAQVHYLDIEEHKGYCRCNADNCVLCQIGDNPSTRFLTPVYDPVRKAVSVLPISDSRAPHALLPQLLAKLDLTQDQLVLLSRDGYKYSVEVKAVPDSLLVDTQFVEDFCEQLSNGQIALTDIYTTLTNEELLTFPSIQTRMLIARA